MMSGFLYPYLDHAMKPVCPKYLYPLFIGTQMMIFSGTMLAYTRIYEVNVSLFSVCTPAKLITLQDEKPHVHQVERFVQGEFEYHDEDLHTPIIW